MASDSGGLPEAKLGVDYVLPVRQIEYYERRLNDRMLPVPVVPEQDISPWLEALQHLLLDRAWYEQLSTASREAALVFVSNVGVEPFEDYLENLVPGSQSDRNGAVTQVEQDAKTDNILEHVQRLSPEKQKLLA